MISTRLSQICLIACLHFLTGFSQTTETTMMSITFTTTVHVTVTDDSGACDHFVSACVVYGVNNAASTTTVYAPGPTPTRLLTSTTIIRATSTVPDGSACTGFSRSMCSVWDGRIYTVHHDSLRSNVKSGKQWRVHCCRWARQRQR
jgi:hypothetical protein